MFEKKLIPHAILWIGTEDKIFSTITYYIQSIFCKNICNRCTNCYQIKERTFFLMHWIQGEIKVEQIEEMLSIAQYKRSEHEPFIFIVPHLDFLSAACANRMLKLLDYADTGYHFIFTARHEKTVIPTIMSRCFIYKEQAQSEHTNFFCTQTIPSLDSFLQYLEKIKEMNEHDFIYFLQTIFYFWIKVYSESDDLLTKQKALYHLTNIKKLLSIEIKQGSFPIIMRSLYLDWIL